MRTIFAAVAMIGAATAGPTTWNEEFAFMQYVAEHNKTYETKEEFTKRMDIWVRHDRIINQSNGSLGHNKFSTWTQDEFQAMLTLMPEGGRQPRPVASDWKPPAKDSNAPTSVDWRTGNCMTPVKDQG